MIRTIQVAERNIFSDPPNIKTVVAATSTPILPDETKTEGEIAYRYIQNTGANPFYYAFNSDQCDSVVAYHGLCGIGGQVDCGHRQSVTVYSTGGTTIAITILRRADLTA